MKGNTASPGLGETHDRFMRLLIDLNKPAPGQLILPVVQTGISLLNPAILSFVSERNERINQSGPAGW
jgi:hypothetical protein